MATPATTITTTSSTDTWQAALQRLEPGLRDILVNATSDKRIDVLASVLDEAERYRHQCLRKRLKVQIGRKQVILRDIFDKIIAWVNCFKSVVDVAVSYDPGDAALPWAGIRFLLQYAIRDKMYFESIIEGLEKVAHMIARYAVFEAQCIQRSMVLHDETQTRLTDLYVTILAFLAKGVEYLRQSSATRFFKSALQSSQHEELRKLSEIDEEIQKISHITNTQVGQQVQAGVLTIQTLMGTLTLKSPRIRPVDKSSIYSKVLEEQQFHLLLDWLSSVPYPQHHARHSEERLPGSTRWLFQHSEYVSWKSESCSSILLLHGIPGCGKTNLCSAVVDAFLDDKRQNVLAAPLAYYYCGDAKFGKNGVCAEEIMRSLTRQIVVIDKNRHEIHEQGLLEYERRAAEARLDGFETPKLKSSDCTDLILHVLGNNPATFVIDGIDEVEESQRHELLAAVIRIRNESASIVKILLSSRDDSAIFSLLSDSMMLRIEDFDTKNDMVIFVENRVSQVIREKRLLGGNVPSSLQEDLKDFLLQRAGEMFLWVNLQMEALCKLKLSKSVSDALQNRSKATSSTITTMYSELLSQISDSDSAAYEVASNAFSWLICMNEPLSSKAFLAAVSSAQHAEEPGPDLTAPELLATCANLIVLDRKLDVFRFAHSSFKDFLEKKPEFSAANVNTAAATSCLEACMSNPLTNIGIDIHPEQRFDLYAAMYWPRHCIAATTMIDETRSDLLSTKLKDFVFCEELETNVPFISWLEAAEKISGFLSHDHILKKEFNAVSSSDMTPFFTACIYGLDDIFQVVRQWQDFDVDQRNNLDHTGLYLASAFGRDKIAQVLLELGADVHIQCGHHGSCLNAACAGGHVVIVEQLLDNGADSPSLEDLQAALRLSFRAGREDVTKTLLENGAVISTQEEFDSVLELASQAGFSEVVEYLSGRKLSSFRISSPQSQKIINALFRKGATEFLKKRNLPGDALATAAFYGQVQIALMCLDKGMDIEKEGRFGTPLRTASLMGHESMVRLLLGRGANVNASGPKGDALQAAAMQGHLSITHALLQNGADANNKTSGYFGTALQAAAYRGHRDVAKAQLDAGACKYDRELCEDAFHAAVEAGQEGILSLFLGEDYCYHRDWRRENPIRRAKRVLGARPTGISYRGRHANPRQHRMLKPGRRLPVSDFGDMFKVFRGESQLGA